MKQGLLAEIISSVAFDFLSACYFSANIYIPMLNDVPLLLLDLVDLQTLTCAQQAEEE